MRTRLWGSILLAVVATALSAPLAAAHEERPVEFPSGRGSVPQYRPSGDSIVVCRPDSAARIASYPDGLRAHNRGLLDRCRFNNLQAAVDAVRHRGTRILLLPGRYTEKPSLAPPRGKCEELKDEALLSYAEQRSCPHLQNLVAILGDGGDKDRACDQERLCNLQIEGTGAKPTDVILDGRFKKLNALRADRADGIYLYNFTVQHAEFNSVYVLESDGYGIDRMKARWNDEYGFLTFASDHGLYQNCEAYGNGDGGLYPGSAAPHNGARHSTEIRNCRSHHNLIGVSGTAGDSLWVHDNRFYANTVGVTLDSFFPNHPGLPQNSSVFRNNYIYSNNQDYYRYWRDGTCNKPSAQRGYEKGVVCPAVGIPIGTGILLAGGNYNVFANNWIYDNWRFGTMQFWVPSVLREEMDPMKQHDTSNYNRYVGNRMGFVGKKVLKNGVDFWWDEEGVGNCWENNSARADGITSNPGALPACSGTPVWSPGNLIKSASLVPCATWSRENNDPAGCDWFQKPPKPE